MRQSAPVTIGIILAAILALSGLTISAIFLQHHIAVETGSDPVLGGLCKDVGGLSSCDAALRSGWGKMVLGKWAGNLEIPTAMFGFVFFACMSSWYIVVGRASGSRRGLHLLPVIGTAIGALICIWLDVIMWKKLPQACPLCLATHIISWVLLIVTLLLWPRRGETPGPLVVLPTGGQFAPTRASQSDIPHPPMHLLLAAVLLAVATSAAGWGIYQWRLKTFYAEGFQGKLLEAEKTYKAAIEKSSQYFAQLQEYDKDYVAAYLKFLAQPQVDIPILPEDPVRGSADAPHTVVVFSDFQCPYCRGLAMMLDQRMKEYPGKFRVVFKYFSMNTKCNDYVKNTLHGASCAAAVTAEAARILGGPEAFWKMHDELFRDPDAFAKSPEDYVKQACEKLKLDNEALWQKIKTFTIWERIRINAGQGNAVGVESTPTFFVDGRLMTAWGDRHAWRLLLEGSPALDTQPAGRISTSGPSSRHAPASMRAATRPSSKPATTQPATQPQK